MTIKKQKILFWKQNFRHNYLYMKRLHKKHPQVQIPMNSPLKAAIEAAKVATDTGFNVSIRFDKETLRERYGI